MTQDQLRQALIELQAARAESNAAFGAVLAATIHPDRKPFTRQYVDLLKKGRAPITDEIARALETLGAMLDGQGELQARARPVTVPLLAVHDLPAHTVIIPPARSCALAGCRIRYIPASPRQRFCSRECRVEDHRRRRA
jgi:hypothetical protein